MTEDAVLTVSPEMVRLNDSRDADWMTAFWALTRDAAAAGRSVQVMPTAVTYTPAEVARMVDVSKATVLRRIADGTITALKRGAHYRVPEAEVHRYGRFLMDQMAGLVADDFDL